MSKFDNNARLAVGSDGRSASLTGLESTAPIFPSRAQAKALGLRRYWGKPCKRGHSGERSARNGVCVKCEIAWLIANPEKTRAAGAAYRAANPEKTSARHAAYRAANSEKERVRHASWAAAHPEKGRAYCAKRRALKLTQRCTCCTDAQIEEFFLQTALYNGHVDHIVPLALGGHHCVKNLQAMTDVDHIEKTKNDLRAIADAKRRSRLLMRSWNAPLQIGQIT